MPEGRPSVHEYGRGYRDGLAEAARQIAALEESRDRLGRELATAHAGVGMERARGDKALARVAELEADLAAHPAERGERLDRTLTLPNGTVVRAGAYLVEYRIGNEGAHTGVFRVTAVGKSCALAEFVAEGRGKPEDVDLEWFEQPGPEGPVGSKRDLRPWSEVYPDRPVPGGE